MRVITAFAHWNGAAASGTFYPALSFYAQNGALLMRVFPSTSVAAGASADVSYAPFPGGLINQAAGGTGVQFNDANATPNPRYLYADANQHGHDPGIAGLNQPGMQLWSDDSYGVLLGTTAGGARIVLYTGGASSDIRLVAAQGLSLWGSVYSAQYLIIGDSGTDYQFIFYNKTGDVVFEIDGGSTQTAFKLYDKAGNLMMYMDSTDQNLHIKTGKAVVADL